MKFGTIFLKFWKLASNYITKLSKNARNNYEIFENFGTMLICNIDKTFFANNLFILWSKEDAIPRLTNNFASHICLMFKHMSDVANFLKSLMTFFPY